MKENDSWNHSRAYGYDSRIHQHRAAPATAHIPIERDERIDLCHQPIGYKESRESVRENMIYRYAAVPSRYISQSKHDKQNGITILETLFTVSLTSFVRRRLSPNEQTILLIILFAADNKRRQGFRHKNVENNLNWGGLPSSYFVVITLFVCFVSSLF
jgi:hypothetical protein